MPTRKVGRVEFNGELLRQLDDHSLMRIFEGCAVLDMEQHVYQDRVEYLMINREFELMNAGEATPSYQMIVAQDDNGELQRVRFERIEADPAPDMLVVTDKSE